MHHFYFIRHAQTEANLAQIMCGGGVDTPLTAFGIEQAYKAQDIFLSHHQNIPAQAIIHSDMQRTRKTATIINEPLSLAVFANTNLKEHIVGDWEGQSWHTILEAYTQFSDPPNGETFADFKSRIRTGFDNTLNNYDTPLIVAHGGVWRAFLHSYGFTPQIHPDNAELYFFEYSDKQNIFVWNIYRCFDKGIKTLISI